MGLETRLQRWQQAGVLVPQEAERIRVYEATRHHTPYFGAMMMGLGALAIVLGFAAVVSANWNLIPGYVKIAVHLLLNLGLGGGLLWATLREKKGVREVLAFLLAGGTLTMIALIGQVYQTQAPMWQPLLLWLVLVSPFLFRTVRTPFTIVVWGVAFGVTTVAFGNDVLGPWHAELAIDMLFPFVLIGVGQISRLTQSWPSWPRLLERLGYGALVVGASLSQIFGVVGFNSLFSDLKWGWPWATLFCFSTVALMVVTRRFGLLVARSSLLDSLAMVSLLVGVSPFIVSDFVGDFEPNLSVAWHIAGAVVFVVYWLFLGSVGQKLGKRWLVNLAGVVVALRLVVVYMEVFGDLLSTGFGLMVSGVLLMALVGVTRVLLRRLNPLGEVRP